MSLKQQINNPKLWQLLTTLLTAVLGYFGYEQVIQGSTPSVDVEVVVHDQTEHTHATHPHVDWKPVIQDEIDKARRAHITEHH